MMVFFGFLLTTIFGFLITLLISQSLRFVERIALAYALGLGLQTLFMFYMALLHIPLTVGNVTFLLIFLVAILIFLLRRKLVNYFSRIHFDKQAFKKSLQSLSLFERFLIGYLAVIFLYINIMGLYWPVAWEWDAIAVYDWRAKVFADTGFMDLAIQRGYFLSYPLLTSMSHTWVYLLGGIYPKFIYSLLYSSFIVLFYFALREFCSRKISLIMTTLTVTSPSLFDHAFFAYTNFPYTFYLTIGILFLYLWMVKKKEGYLVFSGLLIGLSTWVRSQEPFWLVSLAFLSIWALYKKKYFTPFIFALFFFPIQQSWRIYLNKMAPGALNIFGQINQGFSSLIYGFNLSNILEVTIFVIKNTVLPVGLTTLLLIFMISTNFFSKNFKKHLLFLFIIIFNFLALLFGAYIFTFIWPGWRAIPESLYRLTIFFIPLIYYYLGLLAGSKLLGKRKK